MYLKKIFILFIVSLLSFACSSSYDLLINHQYEAPDKLSKYLLSEYQNKAIYEANEMHDWNSAKLYSEKALKATKGTRINPQKISYWKIPKEHITELYQAYNNLIKVYSSAINSNPHDLAIAISSLDCWAEQQEENWQTWDIDKCKNDYLIAMHNIFNAINKKEQIKQNTIINNDSNNSVNVVTKIKNEEIKKIIYFDFDKSTLNNINLQEIKNFLEIHQNEINKYLVVGHTDTKGTKNYNLKLSLARALSVRNLLLKYGINKDNIKVLGKGENNLAIKTIDEIAHPANRRAEISPIN